MLIATAGHIDHGKTTLVRALTGVETDRLPEEKARGISIDLGFAYWWPDQGPVIGFVDVPGHERFVRNMMAGVSGVDLALLVIAADDGVMPQTIEHLQILGLMGVTRGVVALTKIDRADKLRIDAVRAQIDALLAGSALESAQIMPLSAQTGEGLPALAAALLEQRRTLAGDGDHGFRLSIDRAFSKAGAGTVVTGTVVAGHAEVGDSLTLSPLGREVRLRGMQSAGRKADRIGVGERCALNLAGVEVSELHRGDWLVSPALHAPSSRMEARIRVLPERDAPLKHDSRVHFHHGAADIAARVLVRRQKSVAAGALADIRILLDSPTSAVSGDRFVLRDSSGRELIGGGVILDPLASDKRQTMAERECRSSAMALPDPAARLLALAHAPGAEPDLRWFARASNLTDAALTRILATSRIVLAGRQRTIAIGAERFSRLEERLAELLQAHHRDHPGEAGMSRRLARQSLGEPVSPDLFDSLIMSLCDARKIVAEGIHLRLSGHSASYSAMESDLWRKILAVIDDAAPRAFGIAELAKELRLGEAALGGVLQRRRLGGDLWQVTDTRFMLRSHVAALAALAAELDAATEGGFTAANFRDASGLGRNFVIQLLEFFDRIGVTRRLGEGRCMRSDWQAVVGAPDK